MATTEDGSYLSMSTKPQYDQDLKGWDYAVITIYFIIVLGVGIGSMLMNKDRGTVSGYFLAGRSMMFLMVGASLFSSNIGSGHFVGLAGTGAAAGIAVGSFEWNAMFVLLMLGWIFVPVYVAAGITTMPEYLRQRFGGQRIRLYLAGLSIILYIFTKISADLFAGSIFIQVALGWNLYASIVFLLAITAVYAVTGGLKAVIYVESMQTIIMLIGSLTLMGIAFNEIGGWDELWIKYPEAIPKIGINGTDCGVPRDDFDHIFRDPVTSDLPWPGNIFGITIIGMWYWCTDQVIVQRTLAAKNVSHAKLGAVQAGFLKVLPMFIMVFPGMISRILYPDEVGCVDPDICTEVCGTPVGCSNIAYPLLVVRILPTGLKGLLLAVMLAALMSSLTSTFNSGSTIFTMDLWRRMRPNASTPELMVVGRSFILVLVVISVAWVPVIQNASSGQLFNYIQSITSFLGPPIMTVFTIGVFWGRCNEPGAFWGLVIGLIVGLSRMIMEFGVGTPLCGVIDWRPDILTRVHYLYFAMILVALVFMVTVTVSLLTPPIADKYLYRLTFWTKFSKKERVDLDKESKRRKALRDGGQGALAEFDNRAFELQEQDNDVNQDLDNDVNQDLRSDVKKDMSDDDRSSTISENEDEEDNVFKRACVAFCGIESNSGDTQTGGEAMAAAQAALATDISEKRNWKIAANVSGSALFVTGVFLYAWFA